MDELFRSENVVVRRVATADQSRWVITFDNYGIGHGFDRLGFGEDFLRQSGLSAIHVLGRAEDWYQYSEMSDATLAIRAAVAGSDHVMTYGSSMGGYAALRFADAVGATAVLALSPQYSLDPAKVLHDRRWTQDSNRIRWLPEIDGALRSPVKPVVVYDPSGPDGWHGGRIAQDIPVTALRLRHTGHPVTTYLSEIGLLAPLVFQTLDGTLDGPSMERTARERRNRSGVYLGELAVLQPPRRSRTALSLARRAVAVAPGSGHAITGLVRVLTREGHHDEALALQSSLVEGNGRFIGDLVNYANALHAADDYDRACAIAREVVALSPQVAHLQTWAGYLFWNSGNSDEAREALTIAVELDPANVHSQKLLATYRLEPHKPIRLGAFVLFRWLRALGRRGIIRGSPTRSQASRQSARNP